MLNLKFGPNSEARFGSSEKPSELLPSTICTVYGSSGAWKISSTISNEWWELYEHPHNDAIYAVLWITPFVGIILDQCAKNKDRVKTMIGRLDELASLFRMASKSMIAPEHIADIKPPTAGSGIQRSIQQLENEAKFLHKDISGAEVIDCITRVRSLVERAARIHQDTLPQIFAAAKRTTESRQQAEGKGKSGIRKAAKGIPARSPNVRTVPQSSNGHSPQSKTRKTSPQRKNVGRTLSKTP